MQILNLLKKKNNKDYTFEERIRQDILLLSVNDEFLADIKSIQKKYDIPASNKNIAWDGMPFILDDKNFKNDSKALRKKYNLPLSHEIALIAFIQGDKLINSDFMANHWHLNPDCRPMTKEKNDCITLDIYPDTTLKDIQENWPRIKIARNYLLKRSSERKNKSENLERDIEILNLKKEGKK